MAYPYPRERRSLRDLLRSRLRFVRLRARTYGHVHPALRQLNLPAVGSDVKYKSKHPAIADSISDRHAGDRSRPTWSCSIRWTP
jgi:hypothetical protein